MLLALRSLWETSGQILTPVDNKTPLVTPQSLAPILGGKPKGRPQWSGPVPAFYEEYYLGQENYAEEEELLALLEL